jgi:hypothetical protein
MSRERELIHIAGAFGIIASGVFLWIALQSGAVVIPPLAKRLPAPSALPGLLWAFAAYRLWRVRDVTPCWNSAARRLLVASFVHVSLIPYLSWWHAATPPAYQRINDTLLAAAVALGVTAAYQLAFETAARIRDRVLRAELWLSIAATPALAVSLALLLRWSATRAGAGDVSVVEWFVLMRDIPGGPRIPLMLISLMPMIPFAMIMLEARARVLAHVFRGVFGENSKTTE